jgi:hypothetical protein
MTPPDKRVRDSTSCGHLVQRRVNSVWVYREEEAERVPSETYSSSHAYEKSSHVVQSTCRLDICCFKASNPCYKKGRT